MRLALSILAVVLFACSSTSESTDSQVDANGEVLPPPAHSLCESLSQFGDFVGLVNGARPSPGQEVTVRGTVVGMTAVGTVLQIDLTSSEGEELVVEVLRDSDSISLRGNGAPSGVAWLDVVPTNLEAAGVRSGSTIEVSSIDTIWVGCGDDRMLNIVTGTRK